MKKTTIIAILAAMASAATAQTNVSWSTEGNTTDSENRPIYVQRFTVSGNTNFSRLAFNQFARKMRPLNQADTLIEIVPGYYCIASPRFAAAKPGESVTIQIETRGALQSICYGPDGVHAVTADGKTMPVEFHRADITADPSMWRRANGDDPMPYGDMIFDRNISLKGNNQSGPYDIIPSFKKVTVTGNPVKVSQIIFKPTKDAPHSEWMRATLGKDGIMTVEAASEYKTAAIRRINRLNLGTELPQAIIEDYPDFEYRGIMIDIARNYQTPAELKRILALMSRYGMNILHFHFADDEAWRLQIPGFPELTEVGGRRGYTLDEHDFMAQIFTGNGNPDSRETSSNGYFTREEFINLLKTAASLGIKILPEIESPGHARAAIKAMEKRFRLTGDDTYRLIDPEDKSVYTSAQAFHDNVMNPALPGPVRFMTAIARELKAMYDEAGVDMPALHIGGDEVAMGAWKGSPAAIKYMAEKGISDERLLHDIFITELVANLDSLGIKISGWQEIALDHDAEFDKVVKPATYSVNCWSTIGKQKSVPAQSATSGYPTVLSNVDHFYLDMCYSPHPYERGLSWGGYVDEFNALDGYPAILCPVDSAAAKNIIGLSGQLFAETMRSGDMLETFILPKMLGLAERAWNAEKTYSDSEFNTAINTIEVPFWRANGYGWHVRQPGIKVIDGRVVMNTSYDNQQPDVTIHYTTDGSNPTRESAIYTGPFGIPESKQIRAAAYIGGRHSVTTILYID